MIMPELGSLLVERQTQYKDESNTSNLLAIHGTFCGVAILSVVLRLYVISITVLVCFGGEAKAGGLGKHPSLISTPDWENFLHWRFFHSLVIMVGISLVKISIAFFLRRFVPSKNYQRFLAGNIIFLTAFMISCACTLIFNCGAKPEANWDFTLRTTGEAKCFSTKVFTAIGIFNSSINIATDVIFALLPIPIVWNLQTNLRTKLTLVFILSLGLFACAASIVKTIYQAHVLKDPDWTFHDNFFMWNNIEFNIGIFAASLPALRPLFTTILGAAQRFTSSGSRNRQQYGGYNADGLAYRQSNNRASRNPARQFSSRHSIDLKDLQRGTSKHAFGNDPSKIQGVTSTVTAGGDGDSDKVLLDQDYHGEGTNKEWTGPSSRAVIQTTTVQITRY
ncbi:hypothetical protein DV737_g5426, partial [Chaetothyriales sp. CBS 132003]